MRRCCADAAKPAAGPTNRQDGAWLKSLAQARLTELHGRCLRRRWRSSSASRRTFSRTSSCFWTPSARNVGVHADRLRGLVRASAGQMTSSRWRAPKPVEIDLGEGLTFRIAGRIDRIDKVGADAFEVIDYKTGGFWRDNWKGTFNGGRRLQHALYGLAAVELLRSQYKNPKVTAGVYYFSSHKGRQERVRIPAPGPAAIARRPGRHSRIDCAGRLRPYPGRGGLQVLRLHRRLRRGCEGAGRSQTAGRSG